MNIGFLMWWGIPSIGEHDEAMKLPGLYPNLFGYEWMFELDYAYNGGLCLPCYLTITEGLS